MRRKNKKARQLTRFGANVRRQRQRLKLTQGELAQKTGMHPRAVQKVEAGAVNTSLTTILRIQRALKCRWEDLLGKP